MNRRCRSRPRPTPAPALEKAPYDPIPFGAPVPAGAAGAVSPEIGGRCPLGAPAPEAPQASDAAGAAGSREDSGGSPLNPRSSKFRPELKRTFARQNHVLAIIFTIGFLDPQKSTQSHLLVSVVVTVRRHRGCLSEKF